MPSKWRRHAVSNRDTAMVPVTSISGSGSSVSDEAARKSRDLSSFTSERLSGSQPLPSPGLISIEAGSSYYRGQGRFGILVPLIVSAIRDYCFDLLFQDFVIAVPGFASSHAWHCAVCSEVPA